MTSKEELALIKEQFISDIENEETDNCWNETDKKADINWWKGKFQTIEQDLEILEIIKNKLVFLLALMSLPYELYNKSVMKEQQLTQEEYDKIKEWLENELRKEELENG